MQDYRSDNFNYFSKQDQEKQKKKTAWKRVWFWIKIVLYVLLFGITMTGCVQSCVIKSSNYTGTGIEFYTNEKNVSPYVATFKAENNLTNDEKDKLKNQGVDLKDINIDDKNDVISFNKYEKANFNLSQRFYGEQLEAIKKQTNETYNGIYGAYKNYNVALQLYNNQDGLFNGEKQVIENKNGKYMFTTIPVKLKNEKGNYNQNEYRYKYQSIFNDNELKEWKFIDPSFDFNVYFVYDKDKKKFVLKEDTNLIKIGKFTTLIQIGKDKKNQFKFEKDLSVLSISNSNNFYSNGKDIDEYGFGKFRRDTFETLANNTFYSNNSKFYKKALNEAKNVFNISDFSNLSDYIVKTILSKDKSKIKKLEFSPQLYLALTKYSESIQKYLNDSGFSPLNTISPIKEKTIIEYNATKLAYDNQLNAVHNARNVYDSNQTTENKKAFELELEKLNEIKANLEKLNADANASYSLLHAAPNTKFSLSAAETHTIPLTQSEQRVIYDWATAWKLGPFYGLFVWPLAYVSSALTSSMPILAGWGTIIAILIITIVLRSAMFGLTFRSTVNQSKQEELKAKKAKIDAKYAEFKNNKQMKARQQQEVAELYKKNGINPLDSFATMLISMPIFFAIWRVIQALPDMKSTVWLGMSFAETSWRRLFFNQEWQYLGILIVVGLVQGISQFLPALLNRKKFKQHTNLEEAKALKKQNKTQKIIAFVFFFITFMFNAGVQIYWIISGLWTIGQTLGIHYFKKTRYYRTKFLKKENKVV